MRILVVQPWHVEWRMETVGSVRIKAVDRCTSDVVGSAWVHLSRVHFVLLLHRLVVMLIHEQLFLFVLLRE